MPFSGIVRDFDPPLAVRGVLDWLRSNENVPSDRLTALSLLSLVVNKVPLDSVRSALSLGPENLLPQHALATPLSLPERDALRAVVKLGRQIEEKPARVEKVPKEDSSLEQSRNHAKTNGELHAAQRRDHSGARGELHGDEQGVHEGNQSKEA